MMLNSVSLAFLDIFAKVLGGVMPSSHVVFFYKGFLLLAMLPWVLSNGLQGLKTEKIHIHIVRSFFGTMGSLCFVEGLRYVQMADAAALENIQYVLLVFVGMVFFKEDLNFFKIIATLLGFIGAIIVVNPQAVNIITGKEGFISREATYGFTLMAIGFWTMNSITVKILGRTEKNRTQMFYLMLFACIWSSPGVFIKWEPAEFLGLNLLKPTKFLGLSAINIGWYEIKHLIMMSLCYFIHGIAYFKALKRELSIVITFRYTKLLFSGILGYLIFVERPDKNSLLGYVLIVLSGLVLLAAEILKVKKKQLKEAY